MAALLDIAVKKKKMQYDRANLQRAFDATSNGMSVYKASRMYSVPKSTLRDRTRGKTEMEPVIGFDTIFSTSEEKKLVEYVSYMADIGYGYNKIGIQFMAKEFAKSLGKSMKSEGSLSNCWFYGFLKRWPDLTVVKPQKLSIARAEGASKERLDKYYKELSTILTKHNLHDHPERIFNIDETGISTEHAPPRIVCNKNTKPQSIASTRSSTVTILAGGNATGHYIPPYYIFAGKRWNPDFLDECLPGSSGEMSDSGWSNTKIFNNYVTTHFVKHAGVTIGKDHTSTLLLYDGHKSHINLTLTDWAKRNNILLFVLPPHTSHLTQPLDVSVFGPLKAMYNKECQMYMQKNPGINITKYHIAKLTNKPYIRALCAENLMSAFRKTGIYPFNREVIEDSQVAPSTIYINQETTHTEQSQPEHPTATTHTENSQPEHPTEITHAEEVTDSQTMYIAEPIAEPLEEAKVQGETSTNFFKERTITAVVKRPKKKFVPPFLAGNLLKKHNQDIMEAAKVKSSAVSHPVKDKCTKRAKGTRTSSINVKKVKVPSKRKHDDKLPSTSGISKKGGPICLNEDEDDDDDSEFSEDNSKEDLCCVCDSWQPKELRGCISLVMTKWGQCDICNHWTHLIYCSPVRVLRLHDEFRCPHCEIQSN